MNRIIVVLAPLMLVSAPAFAQSHAGHAPAARAQAAPLPAGCVRRGSPTADASRVGAPGAPACPAGAVPERAQAAAPDPHAGHDMSGMSPASPPTPTDPHAGHDMSGMRPAPAPMQTDPHAGHDMSGMAALADTPTSADTPGRPPEDPIPATANGAPTHAADLYFDPAEMAAARERLRVENGDVRTTAVIIDQAEATVSDGEEAYAWEAQGWTGGDINRFWWKSEGEGAFGGALEEAEIQALYSRAVSPFFDIQAGLRQTYRPQGGDRTDLVVGVQGLAPYWFEVDAAAFLSNTGDLTVRAEAEYDLRITNQWILQPRAEVNLSAQDVPELSIGSGLTALQVGLRLRREIRRELAPYVGVEWTRSFGGTADYLEAEGLSAEDTRFVVGLRAWF